MKGILDLPIKWKMVCMLMAVSFFTLLLACGLFAINDLRMFKTNMLRNLSVLAEAVGKNNQAALRFGDEEAALQILSSLEAEHQIYYAALNTHQGNLWVQFKPYKKNQLEEIQEVSSNWISDFFNERVEIRHSIVIKGEKIGEILIKAELSEYKALLNTYFLFGLIIFVTALGLSLIISIKLQAIISKPILDLAETTKRLSGHHDYSVRVSHVSKDEIGTLYLGFNEMLTHIDQRDRELEEYKNLLEEKVQTRTEELSNANESLKRSLEEKDILLNEIHHRVKNNLQIISSLLRLQSNYASNTNSKEDFLECSQRIESMALLYEKIYASHNLSEIELEEYLNDLVARLLFTYGVKNDLISVAINTHSISLGIDSIVPCSLIMQELIANSFKYSSSSISERLWEAYIFS